MTRMIDLFRAFLYAFYSSGSIWEHGLFCLCDCDFSFLYDLFLFFQDRGYKAYHCDLFFQNHDAFCVCRLFVLSYRDGDGDGDIMLLWVLLISR